MAPQDSKIAMEILQSVNNRTQSLRKILCMVISDIVINTLLGRVALDPAGMHCPAGEDAFVLTGNKQNKFCLFVCFFYHAPSPERRAFDGCILRTRISLRFRRGL